MASTENSGSGKDRPVIQSVIRAAPETSTLREAYDRARFNGNTPIQRMDIFFSTIRDRFVSNTREMLGAELDKSLTALPADTMKMIAWAISGDWKRPGDQQFSEGLARSIDHYFDKKSKPMQFGEYDIAMAAGWMPRDPIRVNGVDNVKLTKPITNLFAVMIRNKDGSIEILDPSVKAEGLGTAAAKLTTLPFSLGDNYTDKKWRETSGTYIIGQLLPSILSAGTLGFAKGLGSLTKAETLQRIADHARTLGKFEGAYGLMQLGIVGGTIISGQYQTMLSQAASNQLAKNLTGAMNDPQKISAAGILELLNDGLNPHSRNGSGSSHVYVPSLRKGESPWERLSQVLQGRIDGFMKPNNPWEEWKVSKCQIPDIANSLKENPFFMRDFYSLAEKALKGKKLSDSENLMLRVGSAVIFGAKTEIAGSGFTASSMKFTKAEQEQTLKNLRDALSADLFDNILRLPDMAQHFGIDLEKRKKDSDYAQVSDAKISDAKDVDLLVLAKRRILESSDIIKAMNTPRHPEKDMTLGMAP